MRVLRPRHRPPARCTRTHTALIMATHPATWACVAAATGGKSHQTTSQCTTTTTHLEESIESSDAHVVVVTFRTKMEPTSQWRDPSSTEKGVRLHTPQTALNTGNRRELAYIAHGVTEGRSPITTQTATPTDSHSVVVHQHSGRPTPPRTAKRPTLGLLESDINAGRVHDAGPNVRRPPTQIRAAQHRGSRM